LRYGFIEFMDHDHAMLALRALNNKPNAFGPKTYRPIIMFAVDDMRKLALRKTRLDKSKRKLKVHQLQKELEGGPKTKKQKDY
jgi:nucleolar protein 4